MAQECDNATVKYHSTMLGEHDAQIKANTKDIERHEKLYDLIMINTNTQTEMLAELKTLTKSNVKVVEDVEYLKDNAETKHAVDKLRTDMKHGFDRSFERIETLENKDANDALAREKALKGWLIKGFGGVIFALITAGAMILFALN